MAHLTNQYPTLNNRPNKHTKTLTTLIAAAHFNDGLERALVTKHAQQLRKRALCLQ